jgi:Zn-finger nucleic acid-binding protein
MGSGNHDPLTSLARVSTVPRCPDCKIHLTAAEYENCRVYPCNQCGGLLIGEVQLHVVVRNCRIDIPEHEHNDVIAIADQNRRAKPPMCLTCAKRMARAHFTWLVDVEIDRCPDCRLLWLPRGMLEKAEIMYMRAKDEIDRDPNSVAARKALLMAELERQSQQLREDQQELEEAVELARRPFFGLSWSWLLRKWLRFGR